MGEHLPLVVGRPPGDDVAADDRRLERGGGPGLERLGRLDVVVSIDEDGRPAGDLERLGVDQGVAVGLDQAGVGQAHRPEVVDEELGGPTGVGVVVGLGGDAGNPQERLELLLEPASVGLEVRVHPIDRHEPPHPSPRLDPPSMTRRGETVRPARGSNIPGRGPIGRRGRTWWSIAANAGTIRVPGGVGRRTGMGFLRTRFSLSRGRRSCKVSRGSYNCPGFLQE